MCRIKRTAPAILYAILLASCSLIDIRGFEISTNPCAMNQILASDECVWIQFPEPVVQDRVEPLLSVTAAGHAVSGDVGWDGDRLCFTPIEPYSWGVRHVLQLLGTVPTVAGRSFNVEVIVPFFVGTAEFPPIVVDTAPGKGETVGIDVPLVITFSCAIETKSFEDSLTISPIIDYSVDWDSSDVIATIAPLDRWNTETLYTWTIGAECNSQSGIKVEHSWTGTFLVQEEATCPSVVSTVPVVVSGDSVLPQPGGLSDLLFGDSILISFSEDVDIVSLDSAMTLSPSVGGTLRRVSPGVMVFIPSEDWEMGKKYLLVISTDLKDIAGNPMQSAYRETFTPAIPAQQISGIDLTGTLTDSPSYDTSALSNVTPYVLNWVPSGSVPDTALELSITVRFGRGYDDVHKPIIANAVRLAGYYPSVSSPQITQATWTNDGTLVISYIGFTRSEDHPSLERLYYKLTIPSGKTQTMNQEGSFLKDPVTLLLESGSDS